jgi:hypothetical protein
LQLGCTGARSRPDSGDIHLIDFLFMDRKRVHRRGDAVRVHYWRWRDGLRTVTKEVRPAARDLDWSVGIKKMGLIAVA